jgi:hypothetical protein
VSTALSERPAPRHGGASSQAKSLAENLLDLAHLAELKAAVLKHGIEVAMESGDVGPPGHELEVRIIREREQATWMGKAAGYRDSAAAALAWVESTEGR